MTNSRAIFSLMEFNGNKELKEWEGRYRENTLLITFVIVFGST